MTPLWGACRFALVLSPFGLSKNVLSCLAPKVFKVKSQNFTGMLVNMFSCAAVLGFPRFIQSCRSYVPWLGKNWLFSCCAAHSYKKGGSTQDLVYVYVHSGIQQPRTSCLSTYSSEHSIVILEFKQHYTRCWTGIFRSK